MMMVQTYEQKGAKWKKLRKAVMYFVAKKNLFLFTR